MENKSIDFHESKEWLEAAKKVAQKSTCKRAKCGAVIVSKGRIIGKGFNSPPADSETERRCEIEKDCYDKKVTDKTCCVHAEQRAIMDALSYYPKEIKDARLYFVGLLPTGELRMDRGKIRLYCTLCTKMMLDVGIAEFILRSSDGIVSYPASEYLRLSYSYSSVR